jgi:peptide chain release factor subunit 1
MRSNSLTVGSVEHLEQFRADGHPVLSVFLGVGPSITELRAVSARLKDLLRPIAEGAGALDRASEKSLRGDIDRIIEGGERLVGDPGHGIAVFSSNNLGLFEIITLPASVRDRAVVDDTPYVRPLRAMLEEMHRFAAVVLDHRRAEIFEFYLGRLERWEQLNEEELRKSNYGGFAGYSEHRTRAHADEVAHRHYRDVAARLNDLRKEVRPYDLLLVGGQRKVVNGLVAALDPDTSKLLAGTFSIDLRTMTPALVAEHCRSIAEAHDAAEQQTLVADLVDVAKSGGPAVFGLEWVIDAVNQKAVQTLVVDTSDAVPGGACSSCGWLSVDRNDLCPACKAAMKPVSDIVDASAQAVLQSGGSVRHIVVDTRLSDSHLGALVRFPVAYQA